jgi:hypothetical protein
MPIYRRELHHIDAAPVLVPVPTPGREMLWLRLQPLFLRLILYSMPVLQILNIQNFGTAPALTPARKIRLRNSQTSVLQRKIILLLKM